MTHKLLSIFIVLLTGVISACTSMDAEKHNVPVLDRTVSIERIPVCYNHGCQVMASIQLSENTWASIQQLFINNQSGFEERLAIREAVALFEQEAARHTPVGVDQPRNLNVSESGRQDCLDESTNTTHFLLLLQNNQLLTWHTVGPRAYRAHFFIDQHYSAQIIETTTGDRFVVDSWFLANGEPPYIQPYSSWALKKRFTKTQNP